MFYLLDFFIIQESFVSNSRFLESKFISVLGLIYMITSSPILNYLKLSPTIRIVAAKYLNFVYFSKIYKFSTIGDYIKSDWIGLIAKIFNLNILK